MKELTNSQFYTNNFVKHPRASTSHVVQHKNFTMRNESSENVTCLNNTYISSYSTLSVLGVKLNGEKQVALLLDTGSSVSLLEEKIANDLNLKGPWYKLRLMWSGGQGREDKFSRIVKTEVCGMNSNKSYNMFFRTVRDLELGDTKFIANEYYAQYPHLLPMNLYDYTETVGIIGQDNPFAFEHLQTFMPESQKFEAPFGVRCKLGDYLLGSINPLSNLYDELNYQNRKKPTEIRSMNHHYELTESEHNELKIMENEALGLDYKRPIENDDRKIAEDECALKILEKKHIQVA